ncbi:phospholipase [Herbaspirillum rubrisubalbicans M1]|uniref:phospholipase D-like domain-containing protein n=1 Tax=Herbaspirillum rubrisubalbicans TaxID=80842 RepID=UPI00073A1C39|nr:phospholipase D-like domain-containing protein [Herbaspirillum rubrisubalbicans]ALU87462.1 phospholipase [Herbaspirillum rubrisubalbicans M1]
MTQTHHPGSVPIDLRKRSATATAQWLLERKEDSNSPIYHANQLEVLICGEEGFARILQDIRQARHSVEIICWGFDPAMELERKGHTWPRGPTWGGLLREVAAGKYNNGKPVEVRVLCWNESPISGMAKNTPGYDELDAKKLKSIRDKERLSGKPYEAGLTPQERRRYFNALWFFEATSGTHAHLTFKVRAGNADKVRESLKEEKSTKLTITEHHSLVQASTAHQKTILIDYAHTNGEHAVGYVMGLNSVTDYWDTRQHLFHDPRRGASWEGGGDDLPGLKPFQDYACRICGEALISVSKNFVDAWNRVAASDQKIQRTHDLRSPPAGLRKSAGKSTHRAQIVRTQAEEGDKTIQRLYRQATSFASNYIYIENQYFQYTEWARYLKQLRRDFIAAWKAAGQPMKKLPDLHVFIVTPSPERVQMVPATHETVRELGHGPSMPNQDKKVEGKSSNSNAEIAKELESLGIKTLVASLWTYDHAGDSKGEKYREIYIHSKLMIIDDAFFTLGSANLNLRSMAVDAEINIGCDDARLSGKLRKEVFVLHSANADGCSGGDGSTSEMGSTFSRWEKLLVKNRVAKSGAAAPHGFLHPFRDDRSSFLRIA